MQLGRGWKYGLSAAEKKSNVVYDASTFLISLVLCIVSTMKKVIVHDRIGREQEVSSEKLTFRPSVYGLLFRGQKILLSQQWGGYDFPGGGIEIHETVVEGLEREFWEETGLTVKVGEPIRCSTSFFAPGQNSSYAGQYWNTIVMYFLIEEGVGEISTDHFDEDEKKYADVAKWVDISKVDKLTFYNSVNSPALIRKGFEISSSRSH